MYFLCSSIYGDIGYIRVYLYALYEPEAME